MEKEMTMEEALKEYDMGKMVVKPGSIVKGKVLSRNNDEAMISLGYMADGVLPKDEIEKEVFDKLEEGDEIDVCVLKINDGEGNLLLSVIKAENMTVWSDLEAYMESKEPFTVKTKESVKGGVIAEFKGARVFIPASQLSVAYVENTDEYLKMDLEVVLIDLNVEDKKVVASRKVIEQKQLAVKRERVLSTLNVDDRMTGKVTRIADYGAFVDIGGIDGLVHISEMSWRRVKHPSEIVKEGDMVDVLVLKVDRDNEKVSLRIADIKESPWEAIHQYYEVNDLVKGEVVRITNFGAFVELEEGIDGLVHISEISEERVTKVGDVLAVGQEIDVVILEIDKEKQKMSLSIKAAKEEEFAGYEEFIETDDTKASIGDMFGDKLKDLFK